MKYLQLLFFPEINPSCRVPSRFSFPTSVFDQNERFSLNTGIDGSGFVMFAPKDTTFNSILSSLPNAAYDGNTGNNMLPVRYNTLSDSTFICTEFSQVRLVAASIILRYNGKEIDRSGTFEGGHLYET